jgi:hypothetical protein
MYRLASVVLLALVAAACSPVDVVVEVLPPRTSATCSAPDKSAAALGRGLLDVRGSEGVHGAYVADLRLTAKGQDALVDGVQVAFRAPEGASDAVKSLAEELSGEVTVGDVRLVGEDADIRLSLLENVELVPRALAVALNADDGLGLDAVEYATLEVDITPIVSGTDVIGATTSFAVNLCQGCLVEPPERCSDVGQFTAVPIACRRGQDTPLFSCVGTP